MISVCNSAASIDYLLINSTIVGGAFSVTFYWRWKYQIVPPDLTLTQPVAPKSIQKVTKSDEEEVMVPVAASPPASLIDSIITSSSSPRPIRASQQPPVFRAESCVSPRCCLPPDCCANRCFCPVCEDVEAFLSVKMTHECVPAGWRPSSALPRLFMKHLTALWSEARGKSSQEKLLQIADVQDHIGIKLQTSLYRNNMKDFCV